MSNSRAPALAAVSLAAVFGLSGCNDQHIGAAAGAAVGAVVGSHLSDQTYGRPSYPPPGYYNAPPPARSCVQIHRRYPYPHNELICR